MNRSRQYPRPSNRFIFTKPPKTIYTGTLFSESMAIAPDPKTFPLPPREWFEISEQS